jgi:hypothetical protein
MGVFKLWQGLREFEITDAHASSLTVENWIYKGRLFGLRLISVRGFCSLTSVRWKPDF